MSRSARHFCINLWPDRETGLMHSCSFNHLNPVRLTGITPVGPQHAEHLHYLFWRVNPFQNQITVVIVKSNSIMLSVNISHAASNIQAFNEQEQKSLPSN